MNKTILAIHDISCFGKCSLTVALPILSAMGIETSILPTALLSTHTGGYDDFTFLDLSDQIMPICGHWSKLGLKFDGIYSGYLGSINQIELLKKLFKQFKTAQNIIIVDPVMGDNGKLYTNFNLEFVGKMRELCTCADVIIPNITEACLLLDQPYSANFSSIEEVKQMVEALSQLNKKNVILTGVELDNNRLGIATYSYESKMFNTYFKNRVDGFFHGSGDVFGSVLSGGLINGNSLIEAGKLAADFTVESILKTKALNRDNRQGLIFEDILSMLIENK